MFDWWARAEWASRAVIDELASGDVASWGFWADTLVDAFVGALLKGCEVVGIATASSISESTAVVDGLVEGESGEDSSTLSNINVSFTCALRLGSLGLHASGAAFGEGREVVSVPTASSIGEGTAIGSVGVEGEALEDSVTLSGVDVVGADLGEVGGG